MSALLAPIAGAALPLGLAPFGLWPLTLVSCGLCCALLQRAPSGGAAFRRGWLFGMGKYGLGASWIYVSIRVYGHASMPLAVAIVVAFVAGLALFHGAAGWLYHQLRRRGRPSPIAEGCLFAAVWSVMEWTLTWALTGFPWLFAGYAFIDTPLVGLAPIGGVLLVGFGATATAALLATAGLRPGALAAIAAIWLAAWGLAAIDWTEPGEQRAVALVQADLAQETKWRADTVPLAKERLRRLSAPVWDRDIVLWSEAAIPDLLHRIRPFVDAEASQASGDLVLGAVEAQASADGEAVLHNAALSTGGGLYRKRRLVPFGEYVPLATLLRGAIGFFDLPMSRTTAGEDRQPLLRAAGLDLAMAICYEIAYPVAVARDAARADLLATISNDAWFGASFGPHQHLQIARMRAIENRKALLRATNNGITAIIDRRGAIVARLPQFQAGVLTGRTRAARGATPFGRFGHLPLLLVCAVALAIALRSPPFRISARKSPA